MVIGKCADVFTGIFLVVGVGLRGGSMWEDRSLDEYVMGEENFNEKDAGLSTITIKKQWKNKHGNVFSLESKK